MQEKRNVKLVTTERGRTYFVSEPNVDTAKFIIVNLSATETRKTQIPKNKTVNLGFSILNLSETVMYEF